MHKRMARMRPGGVDERAPGEQATPMRRRDFSTLLLSGGAVLGSAAGCAAPRLEPAIAPSLPAPGAARVTRTTDRGPTSRPRVAVRAICFDLFTLFDPRSVVEEARAALPDGAVELCEAWRVRQFEYAWLRAAAGAYVDFRTVTRDALEYALRARKLSLPESARESLVEAYSRLRPWSDTRTALAAWRAAGLRLAPLANYAPGMLARLIEQAGLADSFDALISTDAAQTFKPDPRAYALGASTLRLEREQIAFAAFGGWDAAGARWFGYPTFWVNRLGVPPEELDPPYDATGPTLAELGTFVAGWHTRGA
jgi:2-haloacid dehalogenase